MTDRYEQFKKWAINNIFEDFPFQRFTTTDWENLFKEYEEYEEKKERERDIKNILKDGVEYEGSWLMYNADKVYCTLKDRGYLK